MLHRLASVTIQVANLVNYNCHLKSMATRMWQQEGDNNRVTMILTHLRTYADIGMFRRSCCGLSFVLFDLILYVPSTIFQLYKDGSSWVEPVLS